MTAKAFFLALYLVYFSGYCKADAISNFIILDRDGKNTCIGDLSCFLSLHEGTSYTLSFNLLIEKSIENPIYKVFIDKNEDADIMKEDLTFCFDDKKKKATITAENCGGGSNVLPGTYNVTAAVELPVFKDVASMRITGPNGADGFRTVVSTLSDQPPIELH